jgi:hypothetical protein
VLYADPGFGADANAHNDIFIQRFAIQTTNFIDYESLLSTGITGNLGSDQATTSGAQISLFSWTF